MDSLVEIAHQARYGVDDIKGMAPFLAFLSTTNPATLPQMGRAASYAMPLLHSGLNMDPSDILMMSTSLARAGATNSKSGTWLRSAFENALPPQEGSMNEKTRQRKLDQLRQLGLVDADGNSTILDGKGNIDIEKYFATAQSHLSGLDLVHRNSALSVAERGKAGFELLSQPGVRSAMGELKKNTQFPEPLLHLLRGLRRKNHPSSK